MSKRVMKKKLLTLMVHSVADGLKSLSKAFRLFVEKYDVDKKQSEERLKKLEQAFEAYKKEAGAEARISQQKP